MPYRWLLPLAALLASQAGASAPPVEILAISVEGRAERCPSLAQTLPLPRGGGAGTIRYDLVCDGAPRTVKWELSVEPAGVGRWKVTFRSGEVVTVAEGEAGAVKLSGWDVSVSIRREVLAG